MFYLLSLAVALQLVVGQALWKIGATKVSFSASPSYIFSPQAVKALLSPYLLGGAAIYVLATVLYVSLLARNDYSAVQSVVVPLSLIFALILSSLLFHERLSAVQIGGFAVLVVGALLVTRG